ncbi:MAG: hypothetical protein KF752_07170 [Pirellulaceae bacterium]|nr:hypothetical protein [Pirellulaceae bacterium]
MSDQVELAHVYFFDTLTQGRQSLRKTIREFGFRKLLTKAAQLVFGKLRIVLSKWLPCGWMRPQSPLELVIFRGLPHSMVDNMNSQLVQQHLQQSGVDLLIVCICKQILSRPTLAIPKYGGLNIHPSLLPKYRGPAPVFWVLYHAESQSGVTFQRMTAKIDQGPIVAQYALQIQTGVDEASLSRQLFNMAAEHLNETILRVKNNETQTSLANCSGHYFSFPTHQDRRELSQRLKARIPSR